MEKEYVLNQIARMAKAVTPEGSVIMLFGSRARRDNRPDSDWDILILLDKDKISLQDIDEVAYPIRELGWDIEEDINPILFTKKEWDGNSATPFHHEVVRDGIVL